MIFRFFSFVFFMCFSSCVVGPNYRPPQICISDDFQKEPESQEAAVLPEDPFPCWWESFDDPLLNELVEAGSLHNSDVLIAGANVLQAMALRRVSASSLFPQVSSNINAAKTYFSKNGPVFAGSSLTEGVSPTTGLPFVIQTPQQQDLYNALIDVSWEIDIFGKIRRQVEASDAFIESSIEQKNDVLRIAVAEIAKNYIDLRSAQSLIELARYHIAFLEQTLGIVQEQKKAGYATELDLNDIEATLAGQKAKLPPLIAESYRAIYLLSLLTGNLPEDLAGMLYPAKPMPEVRHAVGAGLRSDVLRRRPDVKAAEKNLHAATANVGVSIASFFPSLVLIGDGGFQSLRLSNLFTPKSITYDYGGNLNIPIFQGGALSGNLQLAKAEEKKAYFYYQKTVLTALEESESALASYKQDMESLLDLRASAINNKKLVDLSGERFAEGLIPLNDLLERKRRLIFAEENLVYGETKALQDLILVYKALGSGSF